MKTITKKQFKFLIIVQVLVLFAAIIATSTAELVLPSEVNNYIENAENAPIHGAFVVVGAFAILLTLWSLQNFLALYRLRKYARRHALLITIAWLAMSPVFPLDPVIYIGYENWLYELNALLWGATVAVLYFSNIAEYFELDYASTQNKQK